jgi:polysaccharide biosynthesis/export protein
MVSQFLAAAFAVLLLTGPASAASASAAAEQGAPYVLGPNDRITVHCLNAEEFSQTPARIDSDGQVTLPFAGRMRLAGLTVSEAEREVAAKLSAYIVNPEVTVNVVESHSQPVSVLGAVNNPGAYQLEGEKSLSEILSMSGGLRRDSGPILQITRKSMWGPLPLPGAAKDATGDFSVAKIDLDDLVRGNNPALNISIKPFDVVSVPQAEIVYVVGQVKKPGGFTMTGRDGLSVLQALSMAEGLDRMAAPKKARILRKTGTSDRQDISVDLDSILSGKTQDQFLKADDVLFVPNNAAKSAGARTLDAMIQAATGIVIYGRY